MSIINDEIAHILEIAYSEQKPGRPLESINNIRPALLNDLFYEIYKTVDIYDVLENFDLSQSVDRRLRNIYLSDKAVGQDVMSEVQAYLERQAESLLDDFLTEKEFEMGRYAFEGAYDDDIREEYLSAA